MGVRAAAGLGGVPGRARRRRARRPTSRLLTLDEAARRASRQPGATRARRGALAGRAVAGRRARRAALRARRRGGERRRRMAGRRGDASTASIASGRRSCASCTCCAPSWRRAAPPGDAGHRARARRAAAAIPGTPTTGWIWPSCWTPAGRAAEIDATLAAALRAATPPTPALMLAIGHARRARASDGDGGAARVRGRDRARAGRRARRRRAARRGGAGVRAGGRARRRGGAAAARARCWATSTSATAAFWRGEALRRAGRGRRARRCRPIGALALRIVAVLEPRRSRPAAAAGAVRRRCAPGCGGCRQAREALEAGQAEAAVRDGARGAGDAGAGRAGRRAGVPGRGAERRARSRARSTAAQRATELNPTLVDGWRELGDAQLEAGELKERRGGVPPRRRDGHDLRARLREAGAGAAGAGAHAGGAGGDRRGGASAAAIRSSSRRSAATSTPRWSATPRRPRPTTRRCAIEPEDHWALHQAGARARLRRAHHARASELFQAALEHDRDGCHQTLVDYGDHLRRIGPHRRRREAVPARGRRGPGRARVEADAARGRARAAGRAELAPGSRGLRTGQARAAARRGTSCRGRAGR